MSAALRTILLLGVMMAVVSCAGLSGGDAARTPPPGKALVIGMKSGGGLEVIIRTVDGKIMGELPFKPAYEVELDPGTYRIGPFCILKISYGKQFGPADELRLQVAAGHVYKLRGTPGGKMCTVHVDDLTPGK